MAANNTTEAVLRSRYEDGISRGIQQTRDSLGRFQQTVRGVEGPARAASRSAKQLAEDMEKVADAATKLTVPISAALGAGTVGAIKLASAMQDAEIGFETMLGSAQKAQKFLGELQQFAARTPFEFSGLRATASQMMALGFSSKEVIPTLRAVGDAAAGLPNGQEKIERIILALGQMRAKQKVSAEEMMQLSEAGIMAWDILAKAIGVKVPEAMKLAEKGALDANAAVAALVQGMGDKFSGRMEKLSKGLSGQFSNLVDNIQITGTEIGKTFLPDATRAVQKANELLDWAKNAAIAFAKLPAPIRDTAYAIGLLAIIAGPASLALSGIVAGIKNLMIVVGPIAAVGTAFRTVAFAISNGLTGALTGMETVIFGILRLLPPVAAGLGVWWTGNKLLQHAQGNKELNTTAEAIKKINERLKENSFWAGGGVPVPTRAQSIIDKVRSFNPTPQKPAGNKPSIVRPPDAAALASQAKAVQEVMDRFEKMKSTLLQKTASPSQDLLIRWADTIREINSLDLKGVKDAEEKKRQLRAMAERSFLADAFEMDKEKADKETALQIEGAQLATDISAESTKERMQQWADIMDQVTGEAQRRAEQRSKETMARIAREREDAARDEARKAMEAGRGIEQAIALAQQGKIGANAGAAARAQLAEVRAAIQGRLGDLEGRSGQTMEQVGEIIRLRTELERLGRADLNPLQRQAAEFEDVFQQLNAIGMDPFHQTLNAMKSHVFEFAAQGTEAFGTFFAEIVSGQEGAGKRLLAAFIGMIGKMLVQQGVLLIQAGLGQVILSHVFPFSTFLRASDGYKAIAYGVALTAIGGAMMGAASAMTQAGSSGADSGGQQNDVQATTRSSQVQVIQVGAAGRAQNPGAVAPAAQPIELRVKVESNDSHIVRVVERNVSTNGRLRTVIQNA